MKHSSGRRPGSREAAAREFGASHGLRRPYHPPKCELVGRLDQVVLGGSAGIGDSVGLPNTKPF